MKQILWILLLCGAWPVMAEEQRHHHGATTPSEALTVGEGAMAPTGEGVSAAQRCDLARRGVVMLDNAAWVACGGKPATVPASVVPQVAAPAAHHHDHGGH